MTFKEGYLEIKKLKKGDLEMKLTQVDLPPTSEASDSAGDFSDFAFPKITAKSISESNRLGNASTFKTEWVIFVLYKFH